MDQTTIPITDEMIERAARAICEHFGDPDDPWRPDEEPYWYGYRAGARAALEAALRE